MRSEDHLKAVFVSIGIALVPALIGLGLGKLFADDTPYCDITVVPGAWTFDSEIGTCVMPEWGKFYSDGTWEAIDPNL